VRIAMRFISHRPCCQIGPPVCEKERFLAQ
jgi:hypothetical protein